MSVIHILFAFLSISIFASVVGYIWLAAMGDSLILYSTIYLKHDRHNRRFPFKYKVFLTLATIGFFIFMYAGAEAVLFWMPDEWGRISDGVWISTKSSMASLFAFFVGIPALRFVVRSTHQQFFLTRCRMWSSELEKIIDLSGRPAQMMILAEEYKNAAEELRKNRRESLIKSLSIDLVPEARKIEDYERLICIIENLIKGSKIGDLALKDKGRGGFQK